uniref:DNA-directed RNA polymerase N-terminal domain-containing protein n=1 Tax=Salix viminalis TaxID=40686 RepID=A0A6N2L0S1_SALVM
MGTHFALLRNIDSTNGTCGFVRVSVAEHVTTILTKEYKELLKDMCEHKLAPNLPYMKSLFLGWFEPFTDAIAKEQELIRTGKSRQAYAPYFDLLPADKMLLLQCISSQQ